MRIFTCKRESKAKSPERRVPVISTPFGFQHTSAGGHMTEMKSIYDVMNTQALGVLPQRPDLNAFVPNPPATKAPAAVRVPRQFDNNMNMNLNLNIPSPKHLRTVFSSPELRDSDMPQALPQLRAVRSRQSESGASRRRSWFSVRTEIIEGRRTVIRRMLDTMRCTVGDKFDIHDFQRVKPRTATVVETSRTTDRSDFVSTPRRPSSLSWGMPPNVVANRAK